MLAYLFPRDAEAIRKLALEASDSRLWAGIHFRSDLDVGLSQGEQVAALIIDWAKNDGSK